MSGKAERISEIAPEQKPFFSQKMPKTELISGLRKAFPSIGKIMGCRLSLLPNLGTEDPDSFRALFAGFSMIKNCPNFRRRTIFGL
jgi:hypothetical protein